MPLTLITFGEIIDLVLMTFFVAYIFSDLVQFKKRESYEPLLHYQKGFDFEALKFVIMVTAPAIIIHELGHKFVAIGFGLDAVFFAFYRETFTLMLGILSIVSKLTGFGFVFFVPGFVSITGIGTHLQFALTAFAGPFVNLTLWLGSWFLLNKCNKQKKKFAKYEKYREILFLTSKINMFLFIFNMLPIPGFDGYRFFVELTRAIVG